MRTSEYKQQQQNPHSGFRNFSFYIMLSSYPQNIILQRNLVERSSLEKQKEEFYEKMNGMLLDPEKYDRSKYKMTKCTELGIKSLFDVKDSLSPVDITQGELQDCWIVSSVCAIAAKQNNLLESIILNEHANDNGRYCLRLCIAGRWKFVELDDQLPCRVTNSAAVDHTNNHDVCNNHTSEHSRAQQLAFASSSEHLCMPLIEKAFAIVLGCNRYHNLATGFSYEALATLTGSPITKLVFGTTYTLSDQWNLLLSANYNCHPMTASCGNGKLAKIDKQYFHDAKLRPKHCYALLDVDQETTSVLLYNPWGFFRPDNCLQDGTFWMKFIDFLKYFDSVDICKYDSSLEELRFHSLSKSDVIHVHLTERQQLHCALFQELCNTRTPSKDLCLIVLDDKHRFVACTNNRRFEVFVNLDVELEAGHYFLVAVSFHHWNDCVSSSAALNISIHSSSTIYGQIVPESSRIIRTAILKLLYNYGKMQPLCSGVNVRILSSGWSGLLISVENNLEGQFVQLCCDSSQSKNVISTRNSLIVCDSIPPGHEQIVFILTQSSPSLSMSVSQNVRYRISSQPSLPEDMIAVYNMAQPTGQQSVLHCPPLDANLDGLGLVLHTPAFIRHQSYD